jgi:hypothetical protein
MEQIVGILMRQDARTLGPRKVFADDNQSAQRHAERLDGAATAERLALHEPDAEPACGPLQRPAAPQLPLVDTGQRL